MKHFILVISLACSNVLSAQISYKDSQKICELLLKGFPEEEVFIHHDNGVKVPADTLYYRFHYPKASIINDTLRFSYAVEVKDWEENESATNTGNGKSL